MSIIDINKGHKDSNLFDHPGDFDAQCKQSY